MEGLASARGFEKDLFMVSECISVVEHGTYIMAVVSRWFAREYRWWEPRSSRRRVEEQSALVRVVAAWKPCRIRRFRDDHSLFILVVILSSAAEGLSGRAHRASLAFGSLPSRRGLSSPHHRRRLQSPCPSPTSSRDLLILALRALSTKRSSDYPPHTRVS
jgi:hypothetical protein